LLHDAKSLGGWGVVYSGSRKKDKQKVAVKFFGYTNICPRIEEIEHEITLLKNVRHIEGVSTLYGVFMDSTGGYLNKKDKPKLHRQPFPAIVMELLSVDVFTYITETAAAEKTEVLLARLFRSIVTALKSIHENRYVHRDLKLENLMLTAKDDSVAKIIDLGEMVRLPEGLDVLASKSRPPGEPITLQTPHPSNPPACHCIYILVAL
jgi:serine/threonine protein kinase